MLSILIVEDDITFSLMLTTWLGKKGFVVRSSSSVSDAKRRLGEEAFDLVISDLRLPDSDGIDLLKWLKSTHPSLPLIMMTSYAEIQTAVQAMKLGAADYIAKPLNPDELLGKIRELAHVEEKAPARVPVPSAPDLYIEGQSQAARQLYEHVRLVAPTDMSVLVTGASGTGKEYIARRIHEQSNRSKAPFVAVDCGAIPKELAASEFFGHVKGSFTGAIENKTGAFVAAQGGTIFLDEIGNLSLSMQAKLLTALEKRQITRLGATQPIPIDIRLICATNVNIHHLVAEGTFRQDLLYRINTIELHIPPLRERGNDVILLAEHFLSKYAHKYKKDLKGINRDGKNKLHNYAWPGNVRELQHAIERAVILSESNWLRPEDFILRSVPLRDKEPSDELNLTVLEKEAIERALRRAEGNITRAAELLGITRFTLYRKLEKFGL